NWEGGNRGGNLRKGGAPGGGLAGGWGTGRLRKPPWTKERRMKIGARNWLPAEVTEIKRGSVMCQVKVKLASGDRMESVMTLDSIDEMGLKVGDKVRVAVRAVNVLLIKE